MGGKTPKIPKVPNAPQLPNYIPPPAPEPVAAMPVPDDTRIKDAKKRQRALAMQRSGRASTLLSNSSDDKLG